jgi:polyisoprenoid-binding protein YceI
MSTWNIDSVHSTAEFTVRHMMISKVRGQFAGPAGTITFDAAKPSAASVEASVDASTVDTKVTDRNNHLKGADFFEC